MEKVKATRQKSLADLNKEDDKLRTKKETILKARKRAMWAVPVAAIVAFVSGIIWIIGVDFMGYVLYGSAPATIISFLLFSRYNEKLSEVNSRRRQIKTEKRIIKVNEE